jgi:small subunit ribosomal protein S16
MAVHIRLSRAGTKKTPFYRIVVADQRSPRGGRFIERLGTYDPRRPELRVDVARVQHWISQGAQPSATVTTLLRQSAVVAPAAAAPAK